MAKNDRYVVKHPEGWAIKKPSAHRVSDIIPTQSKAEQRAKEIVSNLGGGEVRIQGRDGRWRDSDTGNPGHDHNRLMNAQHVMEKITDLAETAKATALAATESQRLIATALSDAQTKVADIITVATQAVAASAHTKDQRAVLATKSDHIKKAQEHADQVAGDLDRALTAAAQQATEAEGQKSRTRTAADTATELLTNIRTTKGSAETDAAAIESARETGTEA